MPDPILVRSMFARIAGRYDLLNHLLSLGIDRGWRKAAVKAAGDVDGRLVVDACCGTGDLSLAFEAAGARVIGVDFTREMLDIARAKSRGRDARGGAAGATSSPATLFTHGDALKLPVPDGVADVATVAFGIRNVADRHAGLRELRRVLRPGGRLVVLEFTTPPGRILGGAYRTYFTRILPGVGKLVSGDDAAYRYLPETVMAWPDPDAFQREIEAEGFSDCGHELLTRGIACLHWGTAS